MATIDFGNDQKTTFTLDESAGQQTSASIPAGDADDDDIATGTAALTALYTALFTTLSLDSTFADGGRIARSPSDFIVVSSDSTITDISLAGAFNDQDDTVDPLVNFDGDNFDDGGATGAINDLQTVGSKDIHLFSDFNGLVLANAPELLGNIVFGVDESGDIAFVIGMKEVVSGPGEVELQFISIELQAFNHPNGDDPDDAVNLGDFLSLNVEEASGFSFLGTPPGKSNFLMAPALDGEGGLLVTSSTDVVQINTSNASEFGTTIGWGSQGIGSGETVVFSFIEDGLVDDYTIHPKSEPERLDQTEADDPANIHFNALSDENGAQFTIAQTVGNATQSLSLTAYDQDAAELENGGGFFYANLADDDIVAITSVTITRGEDAETFDPAGGTTTFGVGVAFSGGVPTISDFTEGDIIAYTTSDPHQRLWVTGQGGNFDIGQFTTTRTGSFAAPIGEAFSFEDAGPEVTLMLNGTPMLVIDETDGVDNATGETDTVGTDVGHSFLGVNTIAAAAYATSSVNYGTDGPAASSSDEWTFQALTNTVSGLTDVASDSAVMLNTSVDGSGDIVTIIGTASTGGAEVVRWEISKATGAVTTTLKLALKHTNPLDPDESSTPATLSGTGKIVVERTATDLDGDSDTKTVDLTGIFEFEDDGPTVTLTADGTAMLVIDETDGVDNATGEVDIVGGNLGVNTILASAYTTASSVDYGTDGPAASSSKEWTFQALTANTVSGLTDVASDSAVWLNTSADGSGDIVTIIGTASTGGAEVVRWEISKATGAVTTTLKLALKHTNPLDPDESATPATLLGTGLIVVELTATDLDGDSDTKTVDLTGIFEFEDDGPTISPVIVDGTVKFVEYDDGLGTIDPEGRTTDTGFLAYGSDGPGDFIITAFDTLPDDTALGEFTETLSNGDRTLTYTSSDFGDMFTLELNETAPGGYAFTSLQNAPLVLNPLDFAGVEAGGPIEEEVVDGANGLEVTFDGFLFNDADFSSSSDLRTVFGAGDKELPDPLAAFDDVNISSQGVGIDDQQIDPNEGLALFFDDDVEGVNMLLDGGTGGGSTFDIIVQAYDGGTLVDTFFFDDADLPKGNNDLSLEILTGGVSFNELYVVMEFQNSNNGVRIAEIDTLSKADIPDFELEFTVTADDLDGDSVSDMFKIGIDSDSDGSIDIVV